MFDLHNTLWKCKTAFDAAALLEKNYNLKNAGGILHANLESDNYLIKIKENKDKETVNTEIIFEAKEDGSVIRLLFIDEIFDSINHLNQTIREIIDPGSHELFIAIIKTWKILKIEELVDG